MTGALPRVAIAAPASGHGKTTIATGLMAALRLRGLEVAGFKVGPDYIDPGYHALATGRPGRNLDARLTDPDAIPGLLAHGAAVPAPADIAVIEGVMGLYDGAIGGEGFASTAHVATLTGSPVILVVDVSSVSRSVAATVHGFATFDPTVRIAGVIVNKVGSARHATEVRSALEATGVPLLGILHRDSGVSAPSRHLGLVPAAERDEARLSVDHLAAQVAEHLDLDAVIRIAHTAGDLDAEPWDPTAVVQPPSGARPVVAVAGGRAFTFRYAETEELLRAAGCEPVVFDPTADTELPADARGLYLGGGFPEVYAEELAGNEPMRRAIRDAVTSGMPTVAECAGLLYLCEYVDGSPMTGVIDAQADMTPRLTLAYRTAIAPHDTLLARAGERYAGHEFHRTALTAAPTADSAWLLDGTPEGVSIDPAGTGRPTTHASYLHMHWAGAPVLAQRFADAVHAFVPAAASPDPLPRRQGQRDAVDLSHHGDREVGDGLVDLAVNVRASAPPAWLADRIAASLADVASYPDSTSAHAAVARMHRRPVDDVLLTAGGAEAFVLLARALSPKRAVVVHPQFTEPEVALRAAGHPVQRMLLSPGDGFALHPHRVPGAVDAVFIGNPTNPTAALHPASKILDLCRPGRIVVVDEAFMDLCDDSGESLAARQVPGLVVLRSLTKTWSIAGLRAGYAVGDRSIIEKMATHQPPWSVSIPALAAIEAIADGAEVEPLAAQVRSDRRYLVESLEALGLTAYGDPRVPFVLVDTREVRPDVAPPGYLRAELRERGFAVRRCDTFPGLDADWIRVAVRDTATTDALVAAIASVIERVEALA